jgi:hypothetical protein
VLPVTDIVAILAVDTAAATLVLLVADGVGCKEQLQEQTVTRVSQLTLKSLAVHVALAAAVQVVGITPAALVISMQAVAAAELDFVVKVRMVHEELLQVQVQPLLDMEVQEVAEELPVPIDHVKTAAKAAHTVVVVEAVIFIITAGAVMYIMVNLQLVGVELL